MTAPGFQDLRSGLMARHTSPDSVTSTAESNHLAGLELSELQSGPNPVPNKSTLLQKHSIISSLRSKDKTKVCRKLDGGSEAQTSEDDDKSIAIDSARSSFSRAFKECRDRRLKSVAVSTYSERRRPVSLDLNNSSPPSFGVMKEAPTATHRMATFSSPGTPNHQGKNVPLHSNANRRKANTTLLPYHNRKPLPSKWEDAERWICSPASGDGAAIRISPRQPKSKSGPLGPPRAAYYQLFSPGEGGNKLAAHSPCSAGVMPVDGSSTQHGGCVRSGNLVTGTDPCMARSISIHGCFERLHQSSLPVHEDKKYNGTEDVADNISGVVPRKDKATQTRQPLSIQPMVELQSMHSSKHEIRDVPVDECVTMARWSKNNRDTDSRNAIDWKSKAIDIHTWEVPAKTSKNSISKIQREEAKISAWENLQKAKAEAGIRKLELIQMKLEKKRSSSMEKIMNKLRSAQKKAQEMRLSIVTTNHQTARSLEKVLSFRRTRQIGCFMCHAF